jgi:hypothetical protein
MDFEIENIGIIAVAETRRLECHLFLNITTNDGTDNESSDIDDDNIDDIKKVILRFGIDPEYFNQSNHLYRIPKYLGSIRDEIPVVNENVERSNMSMFHGIINSYLDEVIANDEFQTFLNARIENNVEENN